MAFQWSSKSQATNGIEDMVLLSKVTEDQITDNLKKRIQADLMFTYIGPSLVAVNPYKKLSCFTEKEIDTYHGSAAYENPPHIYAVADKMFQNMIIEEENQCVIISGESGAGKTESAKLIMNYIAAVSSRGASSTSNLVDDIKHIILESNPLLESFGNAKTLRNNNSSRFGKYFDINFTKAGTPMGGKISNFLLEKSRVVGPGKGERNFHIFYQIVKGAKGQLREHLGVTDLDYFNYLHCSGEYNADGVDDVLEFDEMSKAMDICQIEPHQKSAIFDIVAGILHLGNITFVEGEDATKASFADPQTLAFPAYLLGIPEQMLREKLLSRVMRTGGSKRGSVYNVNMNCEQAAGSRDALSKALYTRMFDWIVQAVNSALARLTANLRPEMILSLGVLDIFGFEIFQKNGFEQFCINYVNERLQQIFIELTLKSEQEEYTREGIQWTPIEYFNNKVVVDLIESKKPPGIMAILDDVCSTMHAVSDGADQTFRQKLDGAISGNKHYQGMQSQFMVQHYAGSVTYDCAGFTESNKDTLFKDLVQLMQSSNNPFIKALFSEEIDDTDKKRPTTVSFKIKNQTQELVATLMKCTPSYVRCIKPNESKKPLDWDAKRVEHQVRYLNLKENIKVRRAGFCYRNTFEKFLRRFAILTKETFPQWRGPLKDGISIIMASVSIDSKEWQIGSSKVFIKSPESLFLLEEQRDRKYFSYAVLIQRAWRKYKSRKYFIEMRKKAADIMFDKKERKRFSLNREFLGDYLNLLDNPVLKALISTNDTNSDNKNEKTLFSDTVVKYDRSMKPIQREFLITDQHIFIIGAEKVKEGKLKGQLEKVVKRSIPFSQIEGVTMSTLCDDFFVLHVSGDFDNVMENVLKTELVTVLSQNYTIATSKTLNVKFQDMIPYTVKKTKWQSGGTFELRFIKDTTCKQAVVKNNGKSAEIRVAPGLPKDSRPTQKRYQENRGASSAPQKSQQSYQRPAMNPPVSRAPVAAVAATSNRPPNPSPSSLVGSTASISIASRAAALSSPSLPGSNARLATAVPTSSIPAANFSSNNALSAASTANSSTAALGVKASTNNVTSSTGSIMNLASVAAKKRAPPPPPGAKAKPKCKALYNYEATEADELAFRVGDIITIAGKDDPGWWTGTLDGKYVEEIK